MNNVQIINTSVPAESEEQDVTTIGTTLVSEPISNTTPASEPAPAVTAARSKPQVFAGLALREKLRLQALEYTQRLTRSVARQTSYDIQPCVEYNEEVQAEYEMIEKLLYIQNCRSALEHCLDSGAARLRFRWQDGQVSATRFRKLGQGRVEVYGFQLPNS